MAFTELLARMRKLGESVARRNERIHGRTASGEPIDDALVDRLARKAEAGYDVERLDDAEPPDLDYMVTLDGGDPASAEGLSGSFVFVSPVVAVRQAQRLKDRFPDSVVAVVLTRPGRPT